MSQKQYQNKIALIAAGVLSLLSTSISTTVWSSGFQLLEQNVTNLGTAYAGTAALCEDASIGYYNSAGLTTLGEEEIVVSGVGVIPYGRARATQATATVGAVPNTNPGSAFVFLPNSNPVSIAPGSARTRAFGLVPALHYMNRLSDCAVFGLNITSPFGLKTKYDRDSVVRYLSTRGEIRTYDVSPSIAFDFCNGVSIGGGVDFIHTTARFDNRLGFGVPERDGLFENTVSRWAVAGHVGLLFEFSNCVRLGAQYRSGFTVKGRGQSRREDPIFTAFPGPTTLLTQGVHARLHFPGSLVFSAYVDVTECWAWMADVQFTNWKRFKKIVARFDDGTRLEERFDFKDTWRYAFGTSYRFNECFLGRIGVAYDRSPVRSFIKRTTLIPDSDRTWAAVGAQFRITHCLTMEFGYAHLFFRKAAIRQGPPRLNGAVRTLESINGRYKSRADLVGLQFTWEIA